MNDYKELIERLTYLEKGSYENCPIIVYGNVCREIIDTIELLIKERDAAIATIPHKCWSCGKGYHTENGFDCKETWYKGNNPNCLSWQWRGVTDDN